MQETEEVNAIGNAAQNAMMFVRLGNGLSDIYDKSI